MKTEDLKKHIDEILKLTFERVQYAFDHNKENGPIISKPVSRIVFPSYSNENSDSRISEQELRFCFTEAFNEHFHDEKNKNIPLFYSVETPTRKKYSGFSKSKDNPDPNPKPNPKGRSAEFDLVVFEMEDGKMKRRCLVEFKANNAPDLDHKKDFVKLNYSGEWKNKENEEDVLLRYFIELIDGYQADTLKRLKEKTSTKEDTYFICYSLREKKDISCEII